MPILVALALVPTLSFYFYVLVQFWREATRRRRHDTCVTVVPMHSVRTQEPISGTVAWPSFRPAPGSNSIERPARARVLAMYLDDRRAAHASASGRLPLKQAAKG